MRWSVIAFLVGCLLPSAASADDETFPYTAYAKGNDVCVRSGPGSSYYPTDKLKAGQKVEVYRHDPGGWLAIRPPEGSFSWVESRCLRLGENGLAQVTDEQVPAHVGSRLGDIHDVIRVWLHRGEVVAVLDANPAKDSFAAKGPWYKIAPPAGEFRWVDGRDIEATEPDAPSTLRTLPGGSGNGEEPGGQAGQQALSGRDGEATSGPASNESPAAGADRGPSAEQFEARLRDVNLELSSMVVADPGAWYLGELRRRTQGLFEQARTASQRSRTRLLLGKIAWFEEIQERAKRIAAGPAGGGTDQAAAALSPNGAPQGGQLSATGLDRGFDARFDARGQLVRVRATTAGGPQYAILDAEGKILCYVSPAPGVNLQSFVGRVVGINGIVGYMPQQRASHVVARHVSPVDGTVGGPVLR
jgi:hypothetical protein